MSTLQVKTLNIIPGKREDRRVYVGAENSYLHCAITGQFSQSGASQTLLQNLIIPEADSADVPSNNDVFLTAPKYITMRNIKLKINAGATTKITATIFVRDTNSAKQNLLYYAAKIPTSTDETLTFDDIEGIYVPAGESIALYLTYSGTNGTNVGTNFNADIMIHDDPTM